MRSFSFLALFFFNFLSSQDLIFFNDEETISFKKNELININDQKYQYVGAINNNTQIRLTRSKFLGTENFILDTSKIETFRTHTVRFSGRNALKKCFKGFKVGFGFGALLGVAFPFGLDMDSIVEKATAGLFYGSVLGIIVGSTYGAPIGFVYGLVTRGESELHISYYYNIKFKYINQDLQQGTPKQFK